MNCPKFLSMSDHEQKQFIGSLVHAALNDNICLEAGKEIIELAEAKGKFNGVKIGAEATDALRNDDLSQ